MTNQLNFKMTQEEKHRLLLDICARLPYGVKIHLETSEYGELIGTLDAIYPIEERVIVDNLNKVIAPVNVRCGGFKIEENNVKPYLRPMYSMTEEERGEFTKLFCKWYDDELFDYIEEETEFSIWKHKGISPVVFDWLNAHYFDYRGLIEKGLALEATEGMYNI